LDLNVSGSVEIDATSRIDVSERGYLGGYREGLGNVGRTYGNMPGAYLNAGGSYGGMGSLSNNNSWGTARVSGVYGDYRNPGELGSGGSGVNSSWPGGDGGGLVRLTAGSLRVDGAILSNGGGDGSGNYQHDGGGSGGGINVNVGTLEGTGVIRANGGTTYSGNSADAGGGGGRIAIYYEDASGYDFAKVTACGGTGHGGNSGSTIGGAGTVYLEKLGVHLPQIGNLVVNNGGLRGRFPTPIVAVSAGTIASVDLANNQFTDLSANFPLDNPAAGTKGLDGLWVQPDITRKFYYPVVANNAQSVTVIDWDGAFASIARVGANYQGVTIVNNAHVAGNAVVTASGPLVIVGGQLVEDSGGDWNGPVEYVAQLNQNPPSFASLAPESADSDDDAYAHAGMVIDEARITFGDARLYLEWSGTPLFWLGGAKIETVTPNNAFFNNESSHGEAAGSPSFKGGTDDVVIANRSIGERNPPLSPAG
jgi:hypothetical protein